MKGIYYYKSTDTLVFKSKAFGECTIDSSGDMEIETDCEITWVHVDELREIIRLYDERKEKR